MNIHLRILIVFIINLISLNSQSQERVNVQKVKIDKIGGIINEATGYSFSKYTGQWNESKKDQFGSNRCSHVSFYNFFFTTVIKEDISYYILNINFLDGGYKYPTIKQGFYTINKILSFVFDEENFKKISNYEDGSTRFYEFSTYSDGKEINDANLRLLEEATNTALRSSIKGSKYKFRVKKESENVIRFILPISSEYKILEKEWEFDKQYFEISATEFKKLFEFTDINLVR
ncbi:MAG: hypothetical protein KGP35_05335 [Bacteroidetes bacterium]|nr:hypothetical protein [Bacteroidota bacterium]